MMSVASEAIRHKVSSNRDQQTTKTDHKTLGRQLRVLTWYKDKVVAYLGSERRRMPVGDSGWSQLRTFQTGCDQQWGWWSILPESD